MAFKIKDGVSVGLVDVFNNNGELLVNAPTASKWVTSRTISLTGDVSGTVNGVDGSGNISITTLIEPNSVTLGTDTTGNYVATITGSDGVDVSGSGSESAGITINHSDTSTLSGQYGGSGISQITVDGKGHVTAIEVANFLTSFTEADTLQTVTNRGNTTTTAISITNTTSSTSNSTGALVVSGGVGISGAVNIAGNTTIAGDLTVSGTTTTVNSVTTTLTDPILTLGGSIAPTTDDNKDRGVEFRYHNGTVAKLGFFGFDDSTGKFTFIPDATNSSEVFTGDKGTLDAKIEYTDVLNPPTIGNGGLTLSIGSNGATSTSITVGANAESTGFTANTTTDYNYKIKVGPALENLAALMTGTSTGKIQKTGQDTFTLDTTVYLTQAVTTFSTGTTGLLATGEGVSTPTASPVFGNVVLSGILDLDNGGTGANDAPGARTNLGATTVGSNLFTVPNPSEIRYIRINANNTVSLLTAQELKTAIGADFQLTINTANGITGGPVVNSGTYTFELTGTTRSIHDLTTNGILVKTGTTSVATRKLVAGTGITLSNDDGVSGDITINATAATETDTLDSVTDRNAVTANSIRVGGVGYDEADVNVAEVKAITLTTQNSTSAQAIDSWSITTYNSAKYFVQIKQGSNYEIGELIVTHNASNQAKLTHYGVIETNTAITAPTGFTAVISGSTLTLNVVQASATAAQIKMVRTLIRV